MMQIGDGVKNEFSFSGDTGSTLGTEKKIGIDT